MEEKKSYDNELNLLREYINSCEAIVVGAGAGLSASAGLLYSGERFEKNFSDFIKKYSLDNMYYAAFYPYETLEEYWGYFSKHIYHNRYAFTPNATYNDLFNIVKDKNYFVITTNVDHLFQKSGFDKDRLFYTQGDYGLWQCSKPCHNKTYDNEKMVLEMVEKQEDMKIPSSLIPYCEVCGSSMTMNLRADNKFVEDEGWHIAKGRYEKFLNENRGKRVLFLDLGIGGNTPSIIKYPFWQMTYNNKKALYVSINLYDLSTPKEIKDRSLLFKGDIGDILREI